MSEKILPWSEPAEASVLGAILIDQAYLPQVNDILSVHDFYHPSHQAVFKAVLALAEAKRPIEPLTICEANPSLDAAFVAHLMDGIPRLVNARHYAEIVKRASLRRSLVRVGAELEENAYSGDIEPEQAMDMATRRIRELQVGSEDGGWASVGQVLESVLDDLEARKGAGGLGG